MDIIDTTVETTPLTVAAKKSLEKLLERRHEREKRARENEYSQSIALAETKARSLFDMTFEVSSDHYETQLNELVEEARKNGFEVNSNGYGDNLSVAVSPRYKGAAWEDIRTTELNKVTPVQYDDLDAQIAHLWLSDQDVEIRPLFNGALQSLSENNKVEEAQ